jgi:hypothetical protein
MPEDSRPVFSRIGLPRSTKSVSFGTASVPVSSKPASAGPVARMRSALVTVPCTTKPEINAPLHFTQGTEPSAQWSQSGQRVGLRDLGSNLGALCEKDFLQKSVISAG